MTLMLEVQGAVYERLRGAGAVTQYIGDRIYDRVPRDVNGALTATFPYITIGEDQEIADLAECIDGAEVFITVHVWSRAHGYVEAKRIAGAAAAALGNDWQPTLPTNRVLAGFERSSTRYMRDPDGLTSHAVLVFRALTEPT